MRPTFRQLTATALACTLVFTMAACGNQDGKKVATQVAAKVGSEEISVHQINQVLSRAAGNPGSAQDAQAMGREVLEKLIDQQLAVDQAVDNKLHRSPEVVSQIEAARREILARAYIQQITSSVPKPTPEETKKYFKENPALFSERRIFNVQEVVVPTAAGVADILRPLANAGRPIEEVAAALKSKNIQFGGGSAARAAEQIPLGVAAAYPCAQRRPKCADRNPANHHSGARGVVAGVSRHRRAGPAPHRAVLGEPARRRGNCCQFQAAAHNTKITYMGEFANNAATATPNTPAAKSTIEKGVAGLK